MTIVITEPKPISEIIMESGFVGSATEAQALLRGGKVKLNGRVVTKGTQMAYPEDVPATLRIGRYHVIELEGVSR